jgi:ribosomal protein S18 acetylase RimI-like enzyme
VARVDLDDLPLERIDEIEPMWRALYEHHASVAPHLEQLTPLRTADQSWRARRAEYERWLCEPRSFAVLASAGGAAAGYAVARVQLYVGSWETGGTVGALETLSVLPQARGEGVGRALMRGVRERFAARGVSVMEIAVVAGNDAAVRFYEREGALPFQLYMRAPVDSRRDSAARTGGG